MLTLGNNGSNRTLILTTISSHNNSTISNSKTRRWPTHNLVALGKLVLFLEITNLNLHSLSLLFLIIITKDTVLLSHSIRIHNSSNLSKGYLCQIWAIKHLNLSSSTRTHLTSSNNIHNHTSQSIQVSPV